MTHEKTADIIRWYQCISGFTQTELRPTGLFRLHEKLCRQGFNNHVSRVRLDRWNTCWKEVAEHIWLVGQEAQAKVIVDIYAYSWGMGWGAVQLCRELQKRSIDVNTIVSCDGVYKHPWRLSRSMWKRNWPWSPHILIPGNVRFVRAFYQNLNSPQGHKIRGAKDFTGQIKQSKLTATHQYMDDRDEFHAAAIAAAGVLRRLAA